MNAMTGVVGHGHAHQVRQGKPKIRRISDPEKDNNKDRFETPIIHHIFGRKWFRLRLFPFEFASCGYQVEVPCCMAKVLCFNEATAIVIRSDKPGTSSLFGVVYHDISPER
jgi:hypothetical protein